MSGQRWLFCKGCIAGSASPAYSVCAVCGLEAAHLAIVDAEQLREHLEVARRSDHRALRVHRALAAPVGLVAHG